MDKASPGLSHSAEEVGVFDAKTRLSELLDRVASGEEYVIAKHGTPCLLYTSPSPRDRTRSRMPSSA